MTSSDAVFITLGVRPELARALAASHLNVRPVDRVSLLSGTTGGEVLLFDIEGCPAPLATLAEIWSAEPDLPVVMLDDGDPDLRRSSLRAGVTDTVSPPHDPWAVERALVMAAEKRAVGALQFQRELARRMSTIAALTGAAQGRDFLQPVLTELTKLFEVRRASIMLFDDPDASAPMLEIVAQLGLNAPPSVRIAKGVGIAGRVAAEGIPQLLLGGADRYPRFADVATDKTIAASLCVPIRAAGERAYGPILGVLNLARTSAGEVFTPRDLEVCEFIAALVGQALSRIELDQGRADLQQKIAATEKLAYAGELAAGIAHEVASPIGYVKANLKVLHDYWADLAPYLHTLRSEQPDATLDEICDDLPVLLDECLTGVERATRIVHDMKAMVRLDGAQQPKAPVEISEVARSALHLLRPRLADRCKVELKVEPRDCEPIVVRGHELELSQVLVNLVVNGLDACLARAEREPGHQPKLIVRVAAHGSDCEVMVQDNGTGISPSDQARIFAPLFTTKPSGVGTGLGLGIVKRIVASHHGTIELSSTLGEGTTFRVIIPLAGKKTAGPIDDDHTSTEPALR